MTPDRTTQAREEAVLPDRIWIERDAETNEKRWFSIPGMGVEYVKRSASPAAGGVDAVALREICEDMLEMHHGRQASMDVDAPSFGRGAAAGWDAAVSAFYKRALASLSPAPTSGSEAGGEAKGWAAVYDGQIKSCHKSRETCVADAEHYQAIHPVYLGPAWRHQED